MGLLLVVNKISVAAKPRSCRRSAITKTSCATSTTSMFISARDLMIRLSAGGRGNMKKNRSRHRMRSVHVLATTTERKTYEIVAHLDSVDAGGQAGCL